MAQVRSGRIEEEFVPNPIGQHARVILDLSGTRLVDKPSFIEERLLKTPGVIAAEINAFSNRMTVEFNPSLIGLDKIKAIVKAHGE